MLVYNQTVNKPPPADSRDRWQSTVGVPGAEGDVERPINNVELITQRVQYSTEQGVLRSPFSGTNNETR